MWYGVAAVIGFVIGVIVAIDGHEDLEHKEERDQAVQILRQSGYKFYPNGIWTQKEK